MCPRAMFRGDGHPHEYRHSLNTVEMRGIINLADLHGSLDQPSTLGEPVVRTRGTCTLIGVFVGEPMGRLRAVPRVPWAAWDSPWDAWGGPWDAWDARKKVG